MRLQSIKFPDTLLIADMLCKAPSVEFLKNFFLYNSYCASKNEYDRELSKTDNWDAFVLVTLKYINVRKHTCGHVRPVMIRISLRFRAVWSESSLGAAWTDNYAQADLRIRWASMSDGTVSYVEILQLLPNEVQVPSYRPAADIFLSTWQQTLHSKLGKCAVIIWSYCKHL